MKHTCRDTCATDSIIKSGQKGTEANITAHISKAIIDREFFIVGSVAN